MLVTCLPHVLRCWHLDPNLIHNIHNLILSLIQVSHQSTMLLFLDGGFYKASILEWLKFEEAPQ